MVALCSGGLVSRRLRRGISILAVGTALLTGAARADNVRGAWSPLAPWPLVAIHATLLPDGRLLTYGTNAAGQATGRFIYDVWDPKLGLAGGHLTLPNTTSTDIFCNAGVILPETGDVFMAGGDIWTGTAIAQLGTADTNLFRPATNTLTTGPRMSRPRWYATTTTMLDGSVFIQGGRGDDPARLDANSDRPERRNPDGTVSLLTDADTTRIYWYYPRNWVAPDGRIFGLSRRGAYFVDTTGTGMVSGMGLLPDLGPDSYSSSEVMFAPGRILRVGGGRSYGAGTPNAYVIDINRAIPRVTATSPMPRGLHWHNAVALADGRVAVLGGSTAGNRLSGVNTTPFIWNPANGRWTTGAATASGRARLYHSTAILLPDASVLLAGGGADGPQTNLNAEIWYPPYLYDAAGGLAPRPAIVEAPSSVAPQATFTVGVANASAIRRVTLVKTGSVTHSFDMEQRFNELAFTRSGSTLRVTLPRNPASTPPGRYLLFVIDGNGVPSVARLLTIRVGTFTQPAVNWSPTYGTLGDGSWFTASCPSDMVLVGVRGTADARLRSVAPQCARVNAAGRWVGSIRVGTAVGATTIGTTFTRTCPAGSAVTGFRGRAGDDIDQLELACRPMGRNAILTGTASFLPAVGGTAGTARNPATCRTSNPAFALYGSWTTGLRAIGVQCRTPVLTAATS